MYPKLPFLSGRSPVMLQGPPTCLPEARCCAGEGARTALPVGGLGQLPPSRSVSPPMNTGGRAGGSSVAGADRSHRDRQASPPGASASVAQSPETSGEAGRVRKASLTGPALMLLHVSALVPQKAVDVIKDDQVSGVKGFHVWSRPPWPRFTSNRPFQEASVRRLLCAQCCEGPGMSQRPILPS